MWQDPIVQEVRDAREQHAAEVDKALMIGVSNCEEYPGHEVGVGEDSGQEREATLEDQTLIRSEFDTEARFRMRASQGSATNGLGLLNTLRRRHQEQEPIPDGETRI